MRILICDDEKDITDMLILRAKGQLMRIRFTGSIP